MIKHNIPNIPIKRISETGEYSVFHFLDNIVSSAGLEIHNNDVKQKQENTTPERSPQEARNNIQEDSIG